MKNYFASLLGNISPEPESSTESTGFTPISPETVKHLVPSRPYRGSCTSNMNTLKNTNILTNWLLNEWKEKYVSSACVQENLWPTKKYSDIYYLMKKIESMGYLVRDRKNKGAKIINGNYRTQYWQVERSNPNPKPVVKEPKTVITKKPKNHEIDSSPVPNHGNKPSLDYIKSMLEKWRDNKKNNKDPMPDSLLNSIMSLTKYYSADQIIDHLGIKGSGQKTVRDMYDMGLNKEFTNITGSADTLQEKILLLRKKGLSYKQLSRLLKIARSTVWRHLHDAGEVNTGTTFAENRRNNGHYYPEPMPQQIYDPKAFSEDPNEENKTPITNTSIPSNGSLQIIQPDGTIIRVQGLESKDMYDILNKYSQRP